MRWKPAAAATACAPTTPAAGPDSTVRTACVRASVGRDRSAVRLHDRELASRQSLLQPRQIAVDERRDIRIHHRRAPPFELAVLRQHFRRHGHEPARRAQSSCDRLLVRRIDIGMQQAHRGDICACAFQLRWQFVDGVRRERREHAAIGIQALADAERQRSVDDGPRQRDKDVVELRPCLAADADDVFEAGGRRPVPRARPSARAPRWWQPWSRARCRPRCHGSVRRCRQELRATDRRAWCAACA